MTEEEVKKQEKRIEKFNNLNKELIPYKNVAKHISPQALLNGVSVSVGRTYGGDIYVSCYKGTDSLASANIPYSEDIMKQISEIIEPVITAKIREIEEKIDKI